MKGHTLICHREKQSSARRALVLRVTSARAAGVAAAAGWLSFAALAGAQPESVKNTCGEAYEGAQESRARGAWLSARDQLLVCAKEECPGFIRKDCTKWLEEVGSSIPSFVIVAKDPAGADVVDFTAALNGKPLSGSLSVAIEADPGEHELVLKAPGKKPLKQRVMLREGEQRRMLKVVFEPVEQHAEPEPSAPEQLHADTSGSPILPYVLGGVGVLGLGAFAYFGLTGQSQRSDLEETCKPNCTQDQIDEVDQSFLFADISLGVGLVSLGAAAYLLLTQSGSASGTADQARRAPLQLFATPGGGFGSWSGRF